MSEIKNKQHYVFQAYLKNWGDEKKERIWVCNKKEKRVFYVRTGDVLNKRRLYEIQDLNADEKAFFELIMTLFKLNNADKHEMRKHIDAYLLPFENQKRVDILKEKMPVSDSHPQKDELEQYFKKMDLLIKEQKANIEEDFYSDYESDGMRWINSIISGDVDFYYAGDSKKTKSESGLALPVYMERDEFINFLCIQYFRTIEMRNALKNNIINMVDMTRGHDEYKFDRDNIRPESILPHLIWIIQARCSAAFIGRNAKLQVIRNITSLPFITGDQPIINIKSELNNKELEEFVLYYPLSPEVAIIVNGSDSHREKILDKKMEVDELNHKILEHSCEYIVGNTQGVLEGLIDMYL